MGIIVADFQQEGVTLEDQDQLKVERRCCWDEDINFDTYLTTKTKLQVKGNASYLVGTAISLNLSYLIIGSQTGRQHCYPF